MELFKFTHGQLERARYDIRERGWIRRSSKAARCAVYSQDAAQDVTKRREQREVFRASQKRGVRRDGM